MALFAIGWTIFVLLVLLFLTGAKKVSYTPAEQAADDDAQETWLKTERANATKTRGQPCSD